MKLLLTLLIGFLPYFTNAQVYDLIITQTKDSLVCTINTITDNDIIYTEKSASESLQISKKQVKKYFWNTNSIASCKNGFIIKNNGEKVAGEIFINTNSYGLPLDRPFVNVVHQISLKTENTQIYTTSDLQGFYYCDTMYMKIQNTDSSYQFVQILESGKAIILAKGINPEKSKWKNAKKFWEIDFERYKHLNANFNDRNTQVVTQNFEYMKIINNTGLLEVGLISNPLDALYLQNDYLIKYKYAEETYFIITRGKKPIPVNGKNFYAELEKLNKNTAEVLIPQKKWEEDKMIHAVKMINEQE